MYRKEQKIKWKRRFLTGVLALNLVLGQFPTAALSSGVMAQEAQTEEKAAESELQTQTEMPPSPKETETEKKETEAAETEPVTEGSTASGTEGSTEAVTEAHSEDTETETETKQEENETELETQTESETERETESEMESEGSQERRDISVQTADNWFVFDQITNTIVGYSQDTAAPKEIEIPVQINGVDVLKIAENAFLNVNQLTSVTFAEGSKVTQIGANAFGKCSNIQTLTLPDSLTTLGEAAFAECTSLKKIVIPAGISDMIPNFAFQNCTGLETAELKGAVTQIGQGAFQGCTALKSINFPDSLEQLGQEAFMQTALTEVILPDGITTVGDQTFYECKSLKHIHLPAELTAISNQMLTRCSALQLVEIANKVEMVGEKAFLGCSALTEITIPESVKTMAADTFSGTTKLEYIRIPGIETDGIENAPWAAVNAAVLWKNSSIVKDQDSSNEYVYEYNAETGSGCITKYIVKDAKDTTADITADFAAAGITTPVTSIGKAAFWGLAVTKVVLPDTVTRIDNNGFRDCKKLTDITLSKNLESIGQYAFGSCETLPNITLPDSLKRIEQRGFTYCKNLEGIDLPPNLEMIGNSAFEFCQKITEVTIPDKVKQLGTNTFCYCAALEKVTLGKGVQQIGGKAFGECKALTDILIPSSVTSINQYAFFNCVNLNYIRIPDKEKDGIAYAPWSASNASVIWKGTQVVPGADGKDKYLYEWDAAKQEGSITKYLSTDPTADITADFAAAGVQTPVTKIDKHAFNGSTDLTSVIIPDTVTLIDECGFYKCSELQNVQLPKNLKTIGYRAFFENKKLKSIAFPDALTTIEGQAFVRCGSITDLHLPDQLTTIGENAFKQLEKLEEVFIPKSVNKIGVDAFRQCYNADTGIGLKKVEFEQGCSVMGAEMFCECAALTEIILPDSIKTIASSAFRDCTALMEISLPDSITDIQSAAFANCTSLNHVVLKDHVKKLGASAFEGCTSLTDIRLSGQLEELSDSLFSGCSNLKTLEIPDTVTAIGEAALKGTGLTGEFKIPVNVVKMAGTAFEEVTTLDTLLIPYARMKCPYVAGDPYSLPADTAIVYSGGSPLIEHTLSEQQADGTYKLDFTISFKIGNHIVDGVKSIVLPNSDGSAGSTRIEAGGIDEWSTSNTGHTITIMKNGHYKIQIAGLDEVLHEYTVYIGAPVIDTSPVQLYTGDLHQVTEAQLFYVLGLVDEDGNSTIKDEFGAAFPCTMKVEEESYTALKNIKAGETAKVKVKITGDELEDVYEFPVTAVSALYSGKVIWEDLDDAYGIRPEQVTVDLHSENGKEDSLTVQADTNGSWNFTFEASPWKSQKISDWVGNLHVGEEIQYHITTPELPEYTTQVTGSSAGYRYSGEITHTLIEPAPYTAVDLGEHGLWYLAGACILLMIVVLIAVYRNYHKNLRGR